MSTHNIPFSRKKENHPKLSLICNYGYLFLGSQERVRNSHGKQAISVRAIEILLYVSNKIFSMMHNHKGKTAKRVFLKILTSCQKAK